MAPADVKNDSHYIEDAVISFSEIIAGGQKNVMENFQRAHKGELFVLQYLSSRNAAVFPYELSAALQASTARVSALLGALEKKKQIERDIDKSNRRNILVNITDAGHERVKTEMRIIKESIYLIFSEMGETETAEFLRLTQRFSELAHKHMSHNCR